MAETKNLCAQIPIPLHERVSEERERLGQTTSEYISMTTIRTCGQGCWNCRNFREKFLRSSTGPRDSRTLTPVFGQRTHSGLSSRRPHKERR